MPTIRRLHRRPHAELSRSVCFTLQVYGRVISDTMLLDKCLDENPEYVAPIHTVYPSSYQSSTFNL